MYESAWWPPAGEQAAPDSALPEPATVVWRMPTALAASLAMFPVLFHGTCLRLLRAGVPPSRLINPGVVTFTLVASLALAAAVLPPRRRLIVAGGPGWVARRVLPGARWRIVQLSDVATYAVRVQRSRWPGSEPRAVIVLVTGDGRRTSVSIPTANPGDAALQGALAAAGARRVDWRQSPGRLRVTVLTLVWILIVGLAPIGYFMTGPLTLLPRGVAGWFSSSGCRAALTAERESGAANLRVLVRAAEPVGSATWHYRGDWTRTVAQYAAGTADPRGRRTHLEADGATTVDHLEFAGPTGAVLVVNRVAFGTARGASAYVRYVNRATCERFGGTAGPVPSEVRLTRGRYGLTRWVSGRIMYDVSPAASTPRATVADVEGLAAALLAGT